MQNREATDQKVRELAKRVFGCRKEINVFDVDRAATLITQAIAVETAVLREALECVLPFLPTEAEMLDDASLNDGRASEWAVVGVKVRKALRSASLSATDSPGAKAEDTASAEFLKKALEEVTDIGEYEASETGEISDWQHSQVSDASESPTFYTYLRTKEQP